MLNSSYANQDSVTQSNQFVTDVALRECHLPIVPPNSVLVAITGQGKTRGKATVLRIEATINQHLAYITPRNKLVSADYLKLALDGAYKELRAISDDSGSTKGALTCGDLKHFKLALPPRFEQENLLFTVANQSSALNNAIEHTTHEINLIQEYRTRLIADVVTGKLDVRAAAEKLKGEEEEEVKVEVEEELMEMVEDE